MSRRTYSMPARLSDSLILDLPLYSATREQLTDRQGHTLYNFEEGNMDCISTEQIDGVPFYGICLAGVNKQRPAWNIEGCIGNELSFSFYYQTNKYNGHGWCWEFEDESGNFIFNTATSLWGHQETFAAVGNAGPLLSNSDIGTVRFLTVTFEPNLLKIYRDGSLEKESTSNILGNKTPVSVGMRAKANGMADGSNDSNFAFRQYKLFNRALTEEEVSILYAEEAARLSER